MRTESRELLAVGIFGGGSKLGDRIEMLLRRGRSFSPRPSVAGVVASAVVLGGLMVCGSFVPRWIAFAQEQPRLSFEVVSVKPSRADEQVLMRLEPGGRYIMNNLTLKMLIGNAYAVPEPRISGGPGWRDSDRFNIEAKVGIALPPWPDSMKQLSKMLQLMLADRFKLTIHREIREEPVYELVAAKSGAKLLEAADDAPASFEMASGRITSMAVPLQYLAANLEYVVGRPVIDKTGLAGVNTITRSRTCRITPHRPIPTAPRYSPHCRTNSGSGCSPLRRRLRFWLSIMRTSPMRTDTRELLAVGIFGSKSCLGDRIEMLLRRGRTFSPRASVGGVVASAVVLGGLMVAGSLAPRWIAFAQQSPRLAFEVASVKRNTSGRDGESHSGPPETIGFKAGNMSLRMLLEIAYKVKESQITGGPGWIDSDRYDIEARPPEGAISADRSRLMLQALLEDRFRLVLRRETRTISVYALNAGSGGIRLPKSTERHCVEFTAGSPPTPSAPGQAPPIPCGGFVTSPTLLEGGNISMPEFVDVLGNMLERPVVDKTGFAGTFTVHLDFSSEGIFGLHDSGNPDQSRLSPYLRLFGSKSG